MNIGELVVELVLAGLLTLAGLFYPAYSTGLLDFNLSAEILAIAVSLGFALGVIVDRSADTILDRWLGSARLEFAEKAKKERDALVGSGNARDRFPEDWLRIEVLAKGSEATVRALEALRTRIRVARNMVVLTPMLTLSAIVGDWPPHPGKPTIPSWFVMLFPLFELAALFTGVLVASWLKAPHTSELEPAVPSRLASAVVVWFGVHVAAAAVVILYSADRLGVSAGTAAGGFLLTGLAVLAWKRMTVSYFGFLWNHCRFTNPKGLAAHIGW